MWEKATVCYDSGATFVVAPPSSFTFNVYRYSKPKTAVFWDVGGMEDEVPVFL